MAKPNVYDQYLNFAPQMMTGMDASGWSKKAQANILQQIRFESRGEPVNESFNYKPDRMIAVHGNKAHFKGMTYQQKIEEAKRLSSLGSEAVANALYKNINGNTDAGDGYRYRGRGYIQLTGKDNYKRIGDLIGADLVSNPDLLITDKGISQRAAIAYLQEEQKRKKLNYEDLRQVSKAINPNASFEQRIKEAEKRGIIIPSETELSNMTPAEDPVNRENAVLGKISLETYWSRRGF